MAFPLSFRNSRKFPPGRGQKIPATFDSRQPARRVDCLSKPAIAPTRAGEPLRPKVAAARPPAYRAAPRFPVVGSPLESGHASLEDAHFHLSPVLRSTAGTLPR